MTLKRLVLIFLTVGAVILSALNLLSSFLEPQFQSRLELYQTDITLQAQEWKPSGENEASLKQLQATIIGEKPLESATKQYQEVRTQAQTSLKQAKENLEKAKKLTAQTDADTVISQQDELLAKLRDQEILVGELDLRLSILEAKQGQLGEAKETWKQLQQNKEINPQFSQTAAVLAGLWSEPPTILPNAPELIKENLDSWFRYTALSQLYKYQQRPEELSTLKTEQQASAKEALYKLALVAGLPGLGFIIGLGLMLFLLGQRLIKGKNSLLAQNGDLAWSTPWDGETILQVFVIGFFFMGQFIVPLLLQLLPIPRPAPNVRVQALYVLISYALVASGSLCVLFVSLKRFFPLPENWFRFRFIDSWFFWGLGGYCVALPIVAIVSLLNQQLWRGQGGSNPLLQIVLESRDSIALSIFFLTAGVAAPVFEEILFRGFLLPSLTRYMSVWSAIAVSGLLFAIAHFSLSEILPLAALGIVLGIVYTRSRNLLAPILLHSIWNSATLASLFVFGSSN